MNQGMPRDPFPRHAHRRGTAPSPLFNGFAAFCGLAVGLSRKPPGGA